MNERDLTVFLQQNLFEPCPKHSIPEKGMSSRVDAFRSGDVLLRIVVDRGQQFIDLARTGNDAWVDVFTLALRADPSFQVKTGSFSEAIRVLTNYWPKIAAGLL